MLQLKGMFSIGKGTLECTRPGHIRLHRYAFFFLYHFHCLALCLTFHDVTLQVIVELPYLFTLAMLNVIITYPLIGLYWTASKVFWYFYAIFSTFLYFTYMGMLLVSLTPNFQVAAIISSACYTILSLFSGFIIPQPVHFPYSQLYTTTIYCHCLTGFY